MLNMSLLLFCTLIFSVGWSATQLHNCPAILANALVQVQNACAAMGGNQACYGYHTLIAQLSPGLTEFAFNGIGDITPVDTIQSLRLSAFDPTTEDWGVAVMRIRADITGAQPGDNVTLVAFGGVSLNPDTSGDYQPMQAFTLSTGENSSGCTNVTENGLLIQTPEGVGKITLWINQVKIRIGSTVLFQAQPDGDLAVSTFEGSAQVEAMGQMQEAVAGTTVLVPMSADLQPLAPPSPPQAFDGVATGLTALVDVSQSFTDRTITRFIVAKSPVPTVAPTLNVVDDSGEVLASNPGANNSGNAVVASHLDQDTVRPTLQPSASLDPAETAVQPPSTPIPSATPVLNQPASPTPPVPTRARPTRPVGGAGSLPTPTLPLPTVPPQDTPDGAPTEIPPATEPPDNSGTVSPPTSPVDTQPTLAPPTEPPDDEGCNRHYGNGNAHGCYGYGGHRGMGKP